jgi:quinol-cytochrome oxidoreductase complex cytochrome b subunit
VDHFLVLLCGVGFIFISVVALLVLRFVEKYPLSKETQRMLHLTVFIFLTILCILIFDWYSSEYIKRLSES